MTSVRGRGNLARRGQAFKVPTGSLSIRFDNRDHKHLLGSNKPGLPKAPFRSGPLKAHSKHL